jgi:antitoxin (DNA-binding transcriptional repressor) of toxin-antitoxin stability system
MDDVVPMHEAKSTLSRLVQRARSGETILIGPRGEPQVQLTAVGAGIAPKRRLGGLKGKLKVPADLDAPLPDDLQDGFEGR